MAMLPSEIILEEILPKLPAKSLLRLNCVSKQFQTLISSPNFILHHLRYSLSSATSRLLITAGESGLHSFDLDSPENSPVPLPVPNCFRPISEHSIIGCCNGLLLLRGGPSNAQFMLMNPSTGFYTFIPYGGGPADLCSYGFGYDAINDDYKIVILHDWNGVNVASLKDKLWRNLDDDDDDDDLDDVPVAHPVAAVCHNHLCHWLIRCDLKNKQRIVCFDLCIENWTTDVPLPDYKDKSGDNSGTSSHFADLMFEDCWDERNDVTALHVLDGFLSVLTQSNTDCNGYDVWVMKEYGIKESWVKLFGFPDPNSTPVAVGRGSNLKVLCKSLVARRNRLKWYNVRKKQYQVCYVSSRLNYRRLYEVCVVNGSLVTVPGGKRVHDDDQGTQEGWSKSGTTY